MGQVLLLVVAAAWAAVLLPPLLRSRVENRPNSSVSDFRDQLSRLQRAMPTRGVTVRTMSRPLTQSSLTRPAAGGRPGQPAGARARGSVSSRFVTQPAPPRPGRSGRGESRRHEATLRSRQHGAPTPTAGVARAADRTPELKRRRANVLFLLVLTSVCTGFLAATTDSRGMVYAFAISMLALGGYVYLLVAINQRATGNQWATAGRSVEHRVRREVQAPRRAPSSRRPTAPDRYADERYADDRYADDGYVDDDDDWSAKLEAPPQRSSSRSSRRGRLAEDRDHADDGRHDGSRSRADAPGNRSARRRRADSAGYDRADASGYDRANQGHRPDTSGYDRPVTELPARRRAGDQPAARRTPAGPSRQRPASSSPSPSLNLPAGSGVSGRISYGFGDATSQPVRRDVTAADGYGWDEPSGRGAPARNGRHATGQQQAVRRQPQAVRSGGYFTQTG